MAETEPNPAQAAQEFAELQFTDAQIALIMEMDIDLLLERHAQDIDRGRLLAEAEVRRSILQLAKQGSTPAQKEFMDLARKAKLSASRD